MGDKSGIEWTDATWNPVTGCTKVSQGCKNCYAERIFARPYPGRKFTDVRTHPDRLEQPLRWRKPRRIFVNSMSDLFHEDVPFEFIDRVFAVMALAPRHTFQVLTKRPERMRDYIASREAMLYDAAAFLGSPLAEAARAISRSAGHPVPQNAPLMICRSWPLPNVWLGVSVEDQATADERIPLLLQTPAAARFLSCEPLLGPTDVSRWIGRGICGSTYRSVGEQFERCDLTGAPCEPIDWVIAGGESGPNARPAHPDWFRSLRDQCEADGVPFFFKQWGEWAPDCLCDTKHAHPDTPRPQPGRIGCMFRCGKRNAGRKLDGRTWDQHPGSVQ